MSFNTQDPPWASHEIFRGVFKWRGGGVCPPAGPGSARKPTRFSVLTCLKHSILSTYVYTNLVSKNLICWIYVYTNHVRKRRICWIQLSLVSVFSCTCMDPIHNITSRLKGNTDHGVTVAWDIVCRKTNINRTFGDGCHRLADIWRKNSWLKVLHCKDTVCQIWPRTQIGVQG